MYIMVVKNNTIYFRKMSQILHMGHHLQDIEEKETLRVPFTKRVPLGDPVPFPG